MIPENPPIRSTDSDRHQHRGVYGTRDRIRARRGKDDIELFAAAHDLTVTIVELIGGAGRRDPLAILANDQDVRHIAVVDEFDFVARFDLDRWAGERRADHMRLIQGHEADAAAPRGPQQGHRQQDDAETFHVCAILTKGRS
jgi:hypothetical protein